MKTLPCCVQLFERYLCFTRYMIHTSRIETHYVIYSRMTLKLIRYFQLSNSGVVLVVSTRGKACIDPLSVHINNVNSIMFLLC